MEHEQGKLFEQVQFDVVQTQGHLDERQTQGFCWGLVYSVEDWQLCFCVEQTQYGGLERPRYFPGGFNIAIVTLS